MTLWTMYRINRLKRRLRREYLSYVKIRDEYSCGAHLAEHLSSRLREAKATVNFTIGRLQTLDPDNAPDKLN